MSEQSDSPGAEARRVFGERAAQYTTSDCHRSPKILARVVAHAQPQPQWRALDIATGTGHTAFALAPHVAEVVGVDITPEMLAEAEGLRAEHGLTNVTFREADVHDLPFEEGTFDLVTARRAPHHFSGIHRALGEMRRVLKRGGRLVVDDRSVPEDDEADALMNRLDTWHDPSHVREYRPSEWRTLLEAAGFGIEAVEPYTVHRPLSALTDGMTPDQAAEARVLLEGLEGPIRDLFRVETLDGELHHNHWFVMIAATGA
jgi:ubiquinone/menaquinone biosynthesis C-methylase UbiE